MKDISVLCVMDNSNYFKIPNLDLWTEKRNAYQYTGNNKIIAHPPCQQWSKLKSFAKGNKEEKELALFCWEKVNQNGGILEHPIGSSLFKYVNADRGKMFKVYQSWFGFPAQKPTILYCHNVQLLASPICFDLVQKKVSQIAYRKRSLMPLEFCQWLVNCCGYKQNLLHPTFA